MSPSPTHGRGAHVQGVTILGANIQGVFVPEARVGAALLRDGEGEFIPSHRQVTKSSG